MEDNNEKREQEKYTENSGTGALGAIIFAIIAAIAMYFLSKYV